VIFDEIEFGNDVQRPTRRLVPTKVRDATAYIEKVGEPLKIKIDNEIHTVAPTAEEAFQKTSGSYRNVFVSWASGSLGSQKELSPEKSRSSLPSPLRPRERPG
jgi:hypothetical protein